MGALLEESVEVTPPFHVNGTDYAGPFLIQTIKGRGAKIFKCYICLLICFSTNALYLEVVSKFTIETFSAGWKRFISRLD